MGNLMSKLAVKGGASGTGTLTVLAPNTNTDRTITIPDATGTFVTADASGTVTADGGSTNNTDAAAVFKGTGSEHIKLLLDTSSTGGHQASIALESNGNEVSIGTTGSNELRFLTSASEAMRIDASGHVIIPAGVTLGTTAGTYSAANTLDDYEEGTFTATLASGATTTPTATGYYTKTGNIVVVNSKLSFGSITVNGAALQITGLPFTTSATEVKGRTTGSLGGTARVQYQSTAEHSWYVERSTVALVAQYTVANAGGSTALLTEASGTYSPTFGINITYMTD